MSDEAETKVIEEERMKYTLLASNPQLFDSLYGEEEEVEWRTPQSLQEIEELERLLSQPLRGGEFINS